MEHFLNDKRLTKGVGALLSDGDEIALVSLKKAKADKILLFRFKEIVIPSPVKSIPTTPIVLEESFCDTAQNPSNLSDPIEYVLKREDTDPYSSEKEQDTDTKKKKISTFS